jgi:hypothetical protein
MGQIYISSTSEPIGTIDGVLHDISHYIACFVVFYRFSHPVFFATAGIVVASVLPS